MKRIREEGVFILKKILTIMIATIMAFGMMACGGKDKTPENGGLSEESSSVGENSSTQSEGVASDDDPLNSEHTDIGWEADIPYEFSFMGNGYSYLEYEQEKLSETDFFIGYLIMECDLQKWEEWDASADVPILYAFSDYLYHNIGDENLDNRFELYAKDSDYTYLLVRTNYWEYYVYQIVPEA